MFVLLQPQQGGYQACGNVPKAAGTQWVLMAAFSDVSGQSETSLSGPRIDNPENDKGEERLGGVYTVPMYCVSSLAQDEVWIAVPHTLSLPCLVWYRLSGRE